MSHFPNSFSLFLSFFLPFFEEWRGQRVVTSHPTFPDLLPRFPRRGFLKKHTCCRAFLRVCVCVCVSILKRTILSSRKENQRYLCR